MDKIENTSTIEARGPNSGTVALDAEFDVVDVILSAELISVELSVGIPKSAEGSIGAELMSVELLLGILGSVELSPGIPMSVKLSPAVGSGFAPGSGVCAYANLNSEEASPMAAKFATVRIRTDIRTRDVVIVILLTCLHFS